MYSINNQTILLQSENSIDCCLNSCNDKYTINDSAEKNIYDKNNNNIKVSPKDVPAAYIQYMNARFHIEKKWEKQQSGFKVELNI